MRPTNGAKRPAGTREALPGTCCGTVVPRFLHLAERTRLVQKSSLGRVPFLAKMGRSSAAALQRLSGSGSVGEHLAYGGDVALAYLGELLEPTHALGRLGTEQVALAGMHAQDLAVRGDLEALLGAAMSLELLLGLQ